MPAVSLGVARSTCLDEMLIPTLTLTPDGGASDRCEESSLASDDGGERMTVTEGGSAHGGADEGDLPPITLDPIPPPAPREGQRYPPNVLHVRRAVRYEYGKGGEAPRAARTLVMIRHILQRWLRGSLGKEEANEVLEQRSVRHGYRQAMRTALLQRRYTARCLTPAEVQAMMEVLRIPSGTTATTRQRLCAARWRAIVTLAVARAFRCQHVQTLLLDDLHCTAELGVTARQARHAALHVRLGPSKGDQGGEGRHHSVGHHPGCSCAERATDDDRGDRFEIEPMAGGWCTPCEVRRYLHLERQLRPRSADAPMNAFCVTRGDDDAWPWKAPPPEARQRRRQWRTMSNGDLNHGLRSIMARARRVTPSVFPSGPDGALEHFHIMRHTAIMWTLDLSPKSMEEAEYDVCTAFAVAPQTIKAYTNHSTSGLRRDPQRAAAVDAAQVAQLVDKCTHLAPPAAATVSWPAVVQLALDRLGLHGNAAAFTRWQPTAVRCILRAQESLGALPTGTADVLVAAHTALQVPQSSLHLRAEEGDLPDLFAIACEQGWCEEADVDVEGEEGDDAGSEGGGTYIC